MSRSGSKIVATDQDARKTETAAKNAEIDCKPDYSFIPKSFLDQLSFVMMAGGLKYGKWNFRKGHNSSQLTSAATRHIKQIEDGIDFDDDTTNRLRAVYGDKAPQIMHWACVAASALMAIDQIDIGTHRDDRWKGEKK
jgi:hypothetical protein